MNISADTLISNWIFPNQDFFILTNEFKNSYSYNKQETGELISDEQRNPCWYQCWELD